MSEVAGQTQDSQAETTHLGSATQPQAFQADVARLLHLMVHSVYSDRDIFVRELLSNGADACEKLRYEALANPILQAEAKPFAIKISIDKEGRKLKIEDNGIGMSRDELADSLGTIARSGTKAFLERANAASGDTTPNEDDTEASKGSGLDLIGQFGIGFYSAFMVADHVDVLSRKAGSGEAYKWSSNGQGTFEISPIALADAPAPGTRIILHLNEASSDYLETYAIERIVREHSSALTVPIELLEKDDAEPRRLSDGAALWTKPKSAITPEEYTDLYRSLGGHFDEPALTIHWRAEGRHEYTVLAFVPGSKPFDLFDPSRKRGGKLYVRHVLITPDAELLPNFLRFVKIVVDSADLPLNVSREMIQESPVFAAIKKGVSNRILQELSKFAEAEPEKFKTVWGNFGAVLKEGLYEDPEKRDSLFKFAEFASSTHPDGGRTLKDYVDGFKENQTAIYYLLGDDVKRLKVSPQLEGFGKRGVEVLLLPDPVDAFWVSNSLGYDGKPFKSVTQGAADIGLIPLTEEAKKETADALPETNLAALFAYMKQVLDEFVADVRSSDRLSESPACLVAADHGPDMQLERLLAEHGQMPKASKPVLEINPAHALIKAIAEEMKEADKTRVEDVIWLLFDEARLMEGEKPADAPFFAQRLTRILLKAIKPAA